jgi:TonB family protein
VFDLERKPHKRFRRERDSAEIESEAEAPVPGGRSMLGLGTRSGRPAARVQAPVDADVASDPLLPTGRPIFDLERKPDRPFPIERAILFSIVFHILALALFLLMPARRTPPDPSTGLLAAFVPPRDDRPIPVAFKEAPGREHPNPKRSELSDKDRVAAGGDPSKPKSDTPYVPEIQGKNSLAPGAPLISPPRGSRGADAAEREASAAEQQPGPKPPGGPDPYVVPPNGAERQGSGEREQRLANLDGAIKQAARGISQFSGEQGAGFPNPDGGFKDTGPLSFDTSWYDWGPYAAEMIRRIKLHWEIPELARLGWKGRLTIRFFIRGDGRVEGATILSNSGVPPFDHAALQAILTSSPFRPLPKDLGSDREGVTVTFFYNLRPEDARGNEGGKGNEGGSH